MPILAAVHRTENGPIGTTGPRDHLAYSVNTSERHSGVGLLNVPLRTSIDGY
jgi:hypothetical protein